MSSLSFATGNVPTGNAAAAVANSTAFKSVVFAAILLGAVLVGLDTVPAVHESWGGAIRIVDLAVIAVFVIEVIVKIAAWGRQPWRYFLDPWNLFDFTVTVLCVLPLNSNFVQVLRLGRVARSLRLVSALPRLQMIVGALLRSLPSFGWITLLLFTMLYTYSVMGVHLFGANDPEHFGSLWSSLLTMFGVLTLEGWLDLMQAQMRGLPRPDGAPGVASPIAAPIFFVSFIMTGTMIFLNLLVGVIVNSMSELPDGERGGADPPASSSPLPRLHAPGTEQPHDALLAERLAQLERLLAEMRADLRRGR
ncbi:MAG: ion transporter [Phycisphaerales bacterium]|nr:ion transporter [Phycisphaerales bacterium]